MKHSEKRGMEDWLRARYDEGEYYEMLGTTDDVSSRDILLALMERRREYPAFDSEWNMIHRALLQQREVYDSTRALRDLLAQEIADGCPPEVQRRFSKRALWKRLWKPDDPPNFILVRLQIQQEAMEWVRVERAFIEARRQLAAECGEAVFALLDATTNWQEVCQRLNTPAELEQFILQMVKTAHSSAAELPALELEPEEAISGQAKRAYITKAQCERCGGTHRVLWGPADIAAQWDTFLEEHPEFRNLPPERITAFLGQASVEGPCPECTAQVIFAVPKDVRIGWVIQGRDAMGKTHFARVGSVLQEAPRPSPIRHPASTPTEPPSGRPKWADFLLGVLFWGAVAYLAGWFFSHQFTGPVHSSVGVILIVLICIVVVLIVVLMKK